MAPAVLTSIHRVAKNRGSRLLTATSTIIVNMEDAL
jgi:hypothetical protein